MPFGNSRPLALLIAVPYVLSCEVIFFRKKRYFVKLKNRVAAVFIFHEKPDVLLISSLAVAPEFRRFGIASSILSFAAKVAKGLSKKHLELSVLKKNFPAQRLYSKFGFSQKKNRRISLILTKRI
jgi:ribosomal protein S18 acetylase RimI-like enzyme